MTSNLVNYRLVYLKNEVGFINGNIIHRFSVLPFKSLNGNCDFFPIILITEIQVILRLIALGINPGPSEVAVIQSTDRGRRIPAFSSDLFAIEQSFWYLRHRKVRMSSNIFIAYRPTCSHRNDTKDQIMVRLIFHGQLMFRSLLVNA